MKKSILSFLCAVMLVFSITTHAYASDITSFLDGITLESQSQSQDEVITLNPGQLESGDDGKSLNAQKLFLKYRGIATFVTALLTVTSLFILFFYISKLSTSLDNEFSRKKAIIGIATSCAGVVLMGGATTIVAFFYQFFGS